MSRASELAVAEKGEALGAIDEETVAGPAGEVAPKFVLGKRFGRKPRRLGTALVFHLGLRVG